MCKAHGSERYELYLGGKLTIVATVVNTTLVVERVRRNGTTSECWKVKGWEWKGYTHLKRNCRVPMGTHVKVIK